jgi:formylmethanofuran dehydrogenase subunit D
MESKELLRVLEHHRKHVQDSKVFIDSDKGHMYVSSANMVGVAIRTRLKSEMDVHACVNVDTIKTLLKAAGKIDLKVENGRLVIRSNKMKADVPLEPGDKVIIPRVEESQTIPDSDLETLATVLPKVTITRLEKSGRLSIRCKDGELYVSCNDEVHGAIYYGKGESDLEFGVFPQDAELLRSAMDGDNLSIAQSEGRIIVRSSNEVSVIPTTDCVYIPRDVATAKPVAMIDTDELQNILSAVSAIAASKDASPVNITLNSDESSITINVSSPSGSLSKKITSKVVRKATFGVSYQLLTNLVSKVSGKVRLSLFEEGKDVIRIQIDCGGVLYAALTSS